MNQLCEDKTIRNYMLDLSIDEVHHQLDILRNDAETSRQQAESIRNLMQLENDYFLKEFRDYPNTSMYVFWNAGTVTPWGSDERNAELFGIDKIIVHPEFFEDRTTLENDFHDDIALLTVKKGANFSHVVTPIMIPDRFKWDDWEGPLELMGWGRTEIESRNAIVGGLEAEAGEYPFAVTLQVYNQVKKKWLTVCAGSIIDREWVLGAANCFYFGSRRTPADQYRIVAGSTRVTSTSSDDGITQVIQVADVVIHPEMKVDDKPNDELDLFIYNELALIKVILYIDRNQS
ncbi:unnamed protein product, partial [Mesorhabditis spiculigera]